VNTLIGSELTTLYDNHNKVTDPAKTIFIKTPDSVWIEVIALQGKRAQLATALWNT